MNDPFTLVLVLISTGVVIGLAISILGNLFPAGRVRSGSTAHRSPDSEPGRVSDANVETD